MSIENRSDFYPSGHTERARSGLSHGLGASLDGVDDIVIAGAAADIAFQLFTDCFFIKILAACGD